MSFTRTDRIAALALCGMSTGFVLSLLLDWALGGPVYGL